MTIEQPQRLVSPSPGVADDYTPEPVGMDTLDKLDTLIRLTEQLVEELRGRQFPAKEIETLPVASISRRLRVEWIVLSVSAAATVTLQIGTGTARFTWNFAVADARAFPFPVVIDRGINVTATASAGTLSGYLIGTPE